MTPLPGLHPNVPFADYLKWQAVNHSTLDNGLRSMLHLRHAVDHPDDPSDAMMLGTALHLATHEPARFLSEIVRQPDSIERRAGPAWKEFQAAHAGLILKGPAFDSVATMGDNIRKHPAASRLVSMPGPLEVAALWKDETTGLSCKGRLDKWIDGRGIVLDIKTTRNASPRSFSRDLVNFGYARQAAFYLDGLNAIGLDATDFIIVAVENEPPHAVACYSLDAVAVEVGRQENRRLLDQYAACIKSGKWPGYPDTIEPITVPAWAIRDANLSIEMQEQVL